MKAIFSPSLMCMDFMQVGQQLKILEKYVDMLHFDIMDGHFCRNFALSADFLKAVKKNCNLPVDVHMMVSEPADYITMFCDAGADYLSLHAETINSNAFRTIHQLKEYGVKFGVVLNPATSLECISEYLHEIDLLTIMTVDPGFAGQPFNDYMLSKIKKAKSLREQKNAHFIIQADGGVCAKTFARLKEAGNESYIVGTSGLFSLSNDLDKACQIMMADFEQADCVTQN